LRAIFQSVCSRIKKESLQSIITNNHTNYVVPAIEAVYSAADVFPPLKSAAGGALWIARALQVRALSSAHQPMTENDYSLLEGVQIKWKR
jgi:hypothetical protein